MITINNS